MSEDRRAVLESVAFGADARIAPRDRLEALERLREFDRTGPDFDGLTEEEVWAEIDDFHSAMLGAMFVASGPDLELDLAKFPATAQRLREVVGSMTERVIAEREAAGYWGELLAPLPEPEAPAEDAVVDAVVEPEPPLQQRAIGPPRGIDPSLGWPR